jgi:hypothetical protein
MTVPVYICSCFHPTHLLLNLLVDYLDDWNPTQIAHLSMTCKSARSACLPKLRSMKYKRWQHYMTLPYRGKPINIDIRDTYINIDTFTELVRNLNEAHTDFETNYNHVWKALQNIEPETLFDIPDQGLRKVTILCNTIKLITDLASAHHKNAFVTQVLALAAHQYRRHRMEDPRMTRDEHMALYKSMTMSGSNIPKRGPSSLLNIYISHYVRLYYSEKRMQRISVWDW